MRISAYDIQRIRTFKMKREIRDKIVLNYSWGFRWCYPIGAFNVGDKILVTDLRENYVKVMTPIEEFEK